MIKRQTGKYLIQRSPTENYKAFIPFELPPRNPNLNLENVYPLIDEAMLLSGELNNIVYVIPDISLFIYYYVRKEALLSSQIEGTQSSLHDLISFESDKNIDISINDVEEVSNYVKALNYGIKKLNEGFPLCLRLIKNIHKILLEGIRGHQMLPGEFRNSQNWIGGTRPGNAIFVPPPPNKLLELLGDLEVFLNDKKIKLPLLVKVALIHVQFESIHPFLDGNGRIGRLLIILFLYKSKILLSPVLYISLFFKENRQLYYNLLQEVRIEGSWETWIEFFLNGYIKTAKDSIQTIHKLNKIFASDEIKINKLGRAKDSCINVWNHLKKIPLISVTKLVKDLKITAPTARSSLNHLIDLNIVIQKNSKSRDREYMYNRYLQILEKGTTLI